MTGSTNARDVRWLFGYGSLVYRPAFPFEVRELARLDGWGRRFWQGSTDHRGVPGAPGRVATLVESPSEHVHGMAYRLAEDTRGEILARLDHRERGGYSRATVSVQLAERAVDALVYWAGPDNPSYLGPAPIEVMAAQIVSSRGPSGPNTEYVLSLESALAGQGIDDPRLTELARAVRQAEASSRNGL